MNHHHLPEEPFHILVVEDNPGDVRLLSEGLVGTVPYHLHVLPDGEAALGFLRRQPPHASAPTPHLILLDLNMPRMDGRQVLAACKADPALRRIPVIVLTSSQAPGDIQACYDLGANSYITKPADLDQFLALVHSIQAFWLKAVQLPTH